MESSAREKPYLKVIEGASIVHKATPPALMGHARLAHGYPAITATIVNTGGYANWFSYEIDFISQNKEIAQAFETTCRLYLEYRVRFVGDSGLMTKRCLPRWGICNKNSSFEPVIWIGYVNSAINWVSLPIATASTASLMAFRLFQTFFILTKKNICSKISAI
jgi:hypothetical protein